MKKFILLFAISILILNLVSSCKKKTCPAYSDGKVDDKPNYKKSKRTKAKLF